MRILTDRTGLRSFVTDHIISIHGQNVRYKAIAEEHMLLSDQPAAAGSRIASAFTYTYLRTDPAELADRPVIFVFNGGPGSSSVWLHLGFFGPRRLSSADNVNIDPLPPYRLEDNPFCLIDSCDLVMIDPPGTGFARIFDESAAAQICGLTQDAQVFALVIEDWLIRYNRFNSPRFLAGESYGATRACLLLRELMGGPSSSSRQLRAIPVNGIILLGTAITLPQLNNEPAVVPAVLQLMSLAAVNHYHRPAGKPALAEFVDDAWQFAGTSYLAALFAGESLSAEDRLGVCGRLEYFTGIPADWFSRNEMKIEMPSFWAMLLENENLDVGAYDGRYTMLHSSLTGMTDPVAEDPAMGKYTPAFVGAANSALKEELGIELTDIYQAISFAVNGQWDYCSPVSPTEALTAGMRRNERLEVFFGSGLFDLVTCAGQVRYLANHLGLPSERVTIREYASGHMPYQGLESAAQLEADLRAFIKCTI